MLALALGWLAFVAWSYLTFTALERAWPRRAHRVPWPRIALAAGLLGVDAVIARSLITTSTVAPIARLVLAWLLAELFHYAVHRAMHRLPLLWRFHRLHHSDEPLAWTTAWISHPIDLAIFAGVTLLASTIAGAGLFGAAWFVVGRRAWTVLLHANVAWPASVLDNVIATPPFHARHHREDLPGANFATTLPILDRLFGTYESGLARLELDHRVRGERPSGRQLFT